MFRKNNQMPGKRILSGTPSPIYLQVFPQFSFEVGLARWTSCTKPILCCRKISF